MRSEILLVSKLAEIEEKMRPFIVEQNFDNDEYRRLFELQKTVKAELKTLLRKRFPGT